jgi:hypothetical protein
MVSSTTYERRLQVRITRMQWRRMQALAAALEIPISEVVRQSIDDLLDRVEGDIDDDDER